MHRKVQYFQLAWKSFEKKADNTIDVEGYASTSDTDRYNDRVLPSAFANTMPTFMMNPVMLLQHDGNKQIGGFNNYNIESKGLRVNGTVRYDIDDCMKKIENWDLRAFSIGFIVKRYEIRDVNGNLICTEMGMQPGFDINDCWDDKNIRVITELDLVEISVVTTPANPYALFQSAKDFFATEKKSMMVERKTPEEEPKKQEEPQKTEEIKPETPKTDETPAPTEDEKGCWPKKPKKDGDEEEPEDDIEEKKEAPVEEQPKIDPKIEEEAPAGETPATPAEPQAPAEDVPTSDKSDVVKADETPAVAPQGVTTDEVKALIESAIAPLSKIGEEDVKAIVAEIVEKTVAPLLEALEAQKKYAETLEKSIDAVNANHTELKQSHDALERDILSIEIKPGFKAVPKTEVKKIVLTDAMVLRTLGQ